MIGLPKWSTRRPLVSSNEVTSARVNRRWRCGREEEEIDNPAEERCAPRVVQRSDRRCASALFTCSSSIRYYVLYNMSLTVIATCAEGGEQGTSVEFAAIDWYPRNMSCRCSIFDPNLALNSGRY
jgi:hypothetical protein